jgi:predicted nucleic acid-binding protein
LRSVILADTGPLYALRDPDDALHERSHEELRRLRAQRLKLVVPFPTLIESYALVQRRLGLAQARSFLRDLVRTAILLTPTEEDHRGAIGRVLRYPDQDISLADALCAEISERIEAPVWTYDHHFDVMDAPVWRA